MSRRLELGPNEAQLLLHLADTGPLLEGSGVIAKRYFKRGSFRETPYQRATILRMLYRLEELGMIERSPTGLWVRGAVTKLGQSWAKVERAMPRYRKGYKKRVHYPREAAEQGISAYPTRIVHPDEATAPLLKPGYNNGKLGGIVTKGEFRGYMIYSLTLEERASCPRTCERWYDCFGDNMGFATRYIHGRELEQKIVSEVIGLMAKHPDGVLVRLHVLGDFYSVNYVNYWRVLLERFPKLAVFGYTARPPDSDIGVAIRATQKAAGYRRFAIRYSTSDYGTTEAMATATWYSHGEPPPAGTFACPEQTGRVMTCGSCGACWQGQKPVAFLLH